MNHAVGGDTAHGDAPHAKPNHPYGPMLDWAVELQSLAQAGLTYGESVYDRERYRRIRGIAAEMLAAQSDLPLEKVKDLFCNETGYQTPKLDTRAAIFKDDRILLVQESDGTWSLPGGWVDVDQSVRENTVKEAKEESGLDVTADRIIAIQDRNRHNVPPYAYGVCKIFVLCTAVGGHFEPNIETLQSGYFAEDELPELAEAKNTADQIAMCFAARRDPDWTVVFD
ncbi:NUDIX hydrolase N-terminal domain-containing protein [Bifidobacterium callitrichos]|nr:NUDIX hydrolase [Bifidobacterium callitrichos]